MVTKIYKEFLYENNMVSRRGFLKWLGFSAAGVALAGPSAFRMVWNAINPESANADDKKENLIKILNDRLSSQKSEGRDEMWRNIKLYSGNKDYDISYPFRKLLLYVEGYQVGYQKVLVSDYDKIKFEANNVLICISKIKDKLNERLRTKRDTKVGSMSNTQWHNLLRDIETNKKTLEVAPVLLEEYLMIIMLRATLAVYDDNVKVGDVNSFKDDLLKIVKSLK